MPTIIDHPDGPIPLQKRLLKTFGRGIGKCFPLLNYILQQILHKFPFAFPDVYFFSDRIIMLESA